MLDHLRISSRQFTQEADDGIHNNLLPIADSL